MLYKKFPKNSFLEISQKKIRIIFFGNSASIEVALILEGELGNNFRPLFGMADNLLERAFRDHGAANGVNLPNPTQNKCTVPDGRSPLTFNWGKNQEK